MDENKTNSPEAYDTSITTPDVDDSTNNPDVDDSGNDNNNGSGDTNSGDTSYNPYSKEVLDEAGLERFWQHIDNFKQDKISGGKTGDFVVKTEDGFGFKDASQVGSGGTGGGVGKSTTGETVVVGTNSEGNPIYKECQYGAEIFNDLDYNRAIGSCSHAEGSMTTASGDYSHAEGNNTFASGYYSHAEGMNSFADGMMSHAEGYGTVAMGDATHTEGANTFALGQNAHAEGNTSRALGSESHVEGVYGIALPGSHVEGSNNLAGWLGKNIFTITSITETAITIAETLDEAIIFNVNDFFLCSNLGLLPIETIVNKVEKQSDGTQKIYITLRAVPKDLSYYKYFVVSDNASYYSTNHAEGNNTLSLNVETHTEGNRTIAEGDQAHAEGYKTIAKGVQSHSEGSNTEASGDCSHSEGYLTLAQGAASHAEGSANLAIGATAHVEGEWNIGHTNSHVEGLGNLAGFYGKNVFDIMSITRDNTADYDQYQFIVSVFNMTDESVVLNANACYLYASQEEKNYCAVNVISASCDDCQILVRIKDPISTGITDADITTYYKYFVADCVNSKDRVNNHASGMYTVSLGEGSHTEGYKTVAKGKYSHAEGYITKAIGNDSHTEGSQTEANGTNSHAEGQQSIASGSVSHAEGAQTTASGNYSHTEGYKTTTKDHYAHAEGAQTTASSVAAHAEGLNTVASGNYSHAEGNGSKAKGLAAHAEGYYSIAEGKYAKSYGSYTLALSNESIVGGNCSFTARKGAEFFTISSISENTTTGILTITVEETFDSSFCEFGNTDVVYLFSLYNRFDSFELIEVDKDNKTFKVKTNSNKLSDYKYLFCKSSSIAYDDCSLAIGKSVISCGVTSFVMGQELIGNNGLTIGISNKISTSDYDKFTIGNGTVRGTRSNIFRVNGTNGCYSTSSFKSTGADYAEFFLWEDENVNNEDRVGRFVTLNGDKILLANSEDTYIVGIISGDPSVVGDVHDDQWHDMYLRDIFGRPIMEYREEPDEIIEEVIQVPEEVEVEVPDPEDPTKTIKQIETHMIDKIVTHSIPGAKGNFMKVNPDYNPDETYIPRSERPEWGCVGMMGKLVMIDDGTCKVNGFAWASENGIATHSDKVTKFRVMNRIDDSHIKVVIVP